MHNNLIKACNLLKPGCRNPQYNISRFAGGFFGSRKDRSAEIAEFEGTLRPSTPPSQRSSPSPVASRTLAPSVTCSDRRVAPRQVWVESLCDSHDRYLDIIDLHPDIFASFPRIDLVHKNLYWQAHYRIVDWRCITTRAELLYRSQRKPWPQKGTGRARHGNRRTHIFLGGGQCSGPRGPQSFFSILPHSVRVHGLLSMLSAKQAQGDLHVVDNFALSDELEAEAQDVYNLAKQRASERFRLQASVTPEQGVDDLVLRLGLNTLREAEEGNQLRPLTDAIARENEESEELLDLIGSGKSAKAASVALRSAEYLRKLVGQRNWGPSVLFITDVESYLSTLGAGQPRQHQETTEGLAMALACTSYAHYIETEVAPEAAATSAHRQSWGTHAASPRACHPGRGLTLMPLHGLNVWSLVHHDSLVITRPALQRLEERLLRANRRVTVSRSQSSSMCSTPPLANDWLVNREHEKDCAHGPSRHFAEPLGDVETLKYRLQ